CSVARLGRGRPGWFASSCMGKSFITSMIVPWRCGVRSWLRCGSLSIPQPVWIASWLRARVVGEVSVGAVLKLAGAVGFSLALALLIIFY
ncbi:MAG: hypothetical protein QW429_06805, partial [Thermoprotei archaeon]